MPNALESIRVLRAQSGSREALDQLLREVQVPLWRYVRGVVRNDALADDVLQEVLAQVARKLGDLRDPRLFRAWAFRIAARRAYRALKGERAWRSVHVDDEAALASAAPSGPEDAEWPGGAAERIPRLLDALPPAARAAVELHYLGELSLQETADALAIPVGTAKSRISYGLSALRARLRAEPPAGAE
jgi:RNA polymerase sigma-70 factor (ECF subfamily)